MANYGFSFAPTASNMQRGAQAPTSRPQEAVSFRSLTLPQQNTPGQIAAPSLLVAPGAMGMPSGELMKLLMQLLGGQSQRSMAAPSMPSAPSSMQATGAPQSSYQPGLPQLSRLSNVAPHVEVSKAYEGNPLSTQTQNQPNDFIVRPSAPALPSVLPRIDSNTPNANPVRTSPSQPAPAQPTYTPPNYGGFDFGREFGGFLGF